MELNLLNFLSIFAGIGLFVTGLNQIADSVQASLVIACSQWSINYRSVSFPVHLGAYCWDYSPSAHQVRPLFVWDWLNLTL